MSNVLFAGSVPGATTSASQKECFFCIVQHNKSRVLYENDALFFVLDDFPVSPGHGLLVPKRHAANLADLSRDEWCVYYNSINEAVEVIESTDLKAIYKGFFDKAASDTVRWFNQQALEHPRLGTRPDAYNHGVNDGNAAGRTVNHLHWHIIPRYEGDMDDPRGGVRYVRPNMGNYKVHRQ